MDTMSDVMITLEIDKEVKEKAEEYLNNLGYDLQTAITLFLEKVIEVGGIPFEIDDTL